MINGTQNPALPREHEEAAPAADTSRQHDLALCPTWCNGQHLHQAAASEDFQHDGESKRLLPANQQQHDADEPVSVHLSQFVDGDGVTHAPLVELFVGEKGCRLTPLEAIELGRNLSKAIEELLQAQPDVAAGGAVARHEPTQNGRVDRAAARRRVLSSEIFYGSVRTTKDYPGVRFVMPTYAMSGDWECPAVLIDHDILDSAYVLEAVVAFGHVWRLTSVMRKAHREWERDVLPQHLAEAERCAGLEAEKAQRAADVLVAADAGDE